MISPPQNMTDLADKIAREIVALEAAERSQLAEEQRAPSKKRTRLSLMQDRTRLRTWQGALALVLTGNQYEFDIAQAYVEGYRMTQKARRESQ